MREALAQSAHKPPLVLSETFAGRVCRKRGVRSGRYGAAPGDAGQHPLHVRHHRPAQGLHPLARLRGRRPAPGMRRSAAWPTSAPGEERIYNPLPLYHVNAGVVSLMGAILTGNCQIQPDRFHPQRWWREIAETRATVVHYLGIIAPLLLGQPPSAQDGAGTACASASAPASSRSCMRPSRQRFGFPLIELWGMTEMVRVLSDSHRAAPGRHARLRPRRAGHRRARRRRARPRRAGRAARRDARSATRRRRRGGAASRATSTTRRPPRRPGAAAGSTPATWSRAAPTACCISSTARRTSSAAPARTSPPPRSRRCCSPTPTWPRRP